MMYIGMPVIETTLDSVKTFKRLLCTYIYVVMTRDDNIE
jgi:hypothetical protein